MASDVFAVDADELSHVVERMAACEASLHDLAARLQSRVATLHLSWHGEAATAHQAAQLEWEHGFRRIREGLAVMRASANVAHGNYTAAAETNRRLWEQVQ